MSSHRPNDHDTGNAEASREEFADGSALVTYPDGSVMILESALAKPTVMRESQRVSYNLPAPPPVDNSPVPDSVEHLEMADLRRYPPEARANLREIDFILRTQMPRKLGPGGV